MNRVLRLLRFRRPMRLEFYLWRPERIWRALQESSNPDRSGNRRIGAQQWLYLLEHRDLLAVTRFQNAFDDPLHSFRLVQRRIGQERRRYSGESQLPARSGR